MDISLWDDASRDFEEEQAVRRLHAAKSRVAGTWAFLANAEDVAEFAQRRELAVEALADAVWAVTPDPAEAEDTWQRLVASLDEDFAIILEARRLHAEAKTAASHDPIAYVYDADLHCPGCAEQRFGRDEHGFIAGKGAADSEGNTPGVLAPWDETDSHGEHCGTCGGQIAAGYDHQPDDCGYAGCTGKVDEHGRALYRNPRNKSDDDGDDDGGDRLPFEARHQTVAINDAEMSQYSSEVAGNRAADAAMTAPKNCHNCGTHFDGNANNVNFTPGPRGAEWVHCPNCHTSEQHGGVSDCGEDCDHDHGSGQDDDYDDYRDEDGPDYHGLDGDNYGDPYGKMDSYHDFKNSSLHIFRVAAEGGADAYIVVDEESGYKVGGPYASRSDAEAAIASGKFNGKHVKIERAGEEDDEKREEHPGGRGAHDQSGGTKPFDDKGHHRKKSGSRLPFAVAAEDTNPFMDGGNPYSGDDSTGGTSAGGGSGNGLDGPPQAPQQDMIPISTKPRQMPSGGGSDPMAMGQEMGDEQAEGEEGGSASGEDGQVGNNSGATSGGGADQMGGA